MACAALSGGAGQPDGVQLPAPARQCARGGAGRRQHHDTRRRRLAGVPQPCAGQPGVRPHAEPEHDDLHAGHAHGQRLLRQGRRRPWHVECPRALHQLWRDEGDDEPGRADRHVQCQGHGRRRHLCLRAGRPPRRWHHGQVRGLLHWQLQLHSGGRRPGAELLY